MRFSLFLALALLPVGPAAFAAAASTPDVLDQSHEGPGGFATPGSAFAQVFTAGRSGLLTRIEVPLRPSGRDLGISATVELRLLKVDGDKPAPLFGSVLFVQSKSIPSAAAEPYESGGVFSMERFQWIGFTGIELEVNAGDKFAIALNAAAGSPQYDWVVSYPQQKPFEYHSGAPWLFNEIAGEFHPFTTVEDFNFRTFVSVPEPTTLATSAIALTALAAFRRRK